MAERYESKSLRVIVLDDEPMVLAALAQLLKAMKVDVVATTDGQQALDWLTSGDSRPIDAAILDLTIPDAIGGQEIAARVREIVPRKAYLVATSGDITHQAMRCPSEFGFDASLPKPFALKDLTELVERIRQHTTTD